MKGFSQCLILGLTWLLVACSQEHAEVSSQVISQSVPIQMTIDANFEDEALQEDLRNLILQTQPQSIKPVLKKFAKGDQVKLRLVFSNGTNTYTREVTFTTNDELKLAYKGPIDIPNFNGNTKWYVTAFFGGALDNGAYVYNPGGGGTLPIGPQGGDVRIPDYIDLPYMSGWTPVNATFNARSREWQGSFSLRIKPVGYLIRLKIKNNRDHKITARSVRINQDEVTFAARFQPTFTKQAFEAGAFPAVSRANSGSWDYRLISNGTGYGKNGLVIDKNKEDENAWVFWIMPTRPVSAERKINLKLVHYNLGSEWNFPFSITLDRNDETGVGGMSGLKRVVIPNDHKIYRKLYTLDYIAKSNEAGTYTWAEYPHKTSSQNMTSTDWSNILPSDITFKNGSSRNTATSNVGYKGIYNSRAGVVTLYAIRQVEDQDRVAFRYTYRSNGSMTIEMVPQQHLDTAAPQKTVDEIAKDDFWTEAYTFGEVVKRDFPGNGNNTYYIGVNNGNLAGTWFNWSRGQMYHNQSYPRERHFVRFKMSTPQPVDAQ